MTAEQETDTCSSTATHVTDDMHVCCTLPQEDQGDLLYGPCNSWYLADSTLFSLRKVNSNISENE